MRAPQILLKAFESLLRMVFDGSEVMGLCASSHRRLLRAVLRAWLPSHTTVLPYARQKQCRLVETDVRLSHRTMEEPSKNPWPSGFLVRRPIRLIRFKTALSLFDDIDDGFSFFENGSRRTPRPTTNGQKDCVSFERPRDSST